MSMIPLRVAMPKRVTKPTSDATDVSPSLAMRTAATPHPWICQIPRRKREIRRRICGDPQHAGFSGGEPPRHEKLIAVKLFSNFFALTCIFRPLSLVLCLEGHYLRAC